jgi:D-arabinose 1-dehydrogenase-like Zn-dependent alcohol dehydrogenase
MQMAATMRAVQVVSAGGPFELVTRPLPEPGAGEVRVRVQACGVCHSDVFVKAGGWPGLTYPRVPGHEVAGVIDAVGPGVTRWKSGQRVGVGWFGGNCGHCDPCRRGDFVSCQYLQVCGISYDGGYAEAMIAPVTALALIPADLDAVDAAPLLCAGVTTFNALRRSAARAGDLVAVLGIGGLGHLGVQYARKMGFRTVAIARGADKGPLARTLGAHHYIDSATQNVAAELMALGGATVVLSTVTNGAAMTATIDGLAPHGTLILLGVSPDPVQVHPGQMVGKSRTVHGHPSGTSMDSQETLGFSELSGVRPMVERMPLERASEAYDRMMSGDARFRVVLTTGQ